MRLLPAMLLAALATGVLADEQPVVVELYTSQGCSSCPPADALLRELADMEGIIALSLHVDYWDYIGWPDGFASPAHSARQRAYAKAASDPMVYTPQVIVNGQDRMVGNDAMAVMEQVHAHSGVETAVDLSVSREGESLAVEARAEGALLPTLEVHLVRYRPSQTVTIERGENAGRTVAYSNIVTSWDKLGEWTGQGPLSLTVPAPGLAPAVILLQEPGPGRIIAAAEVR